MCWRSRVGFAGKISPTHIVTVLVLVLEFSKNLAEFCFFFSRYLTYRMVPCLVTLTDLEMRRVGLSASAELLVFAFCPVVLVWPPQ